MSTRWVEDEDEDVMLAEVRADFSATSCHPRSGHSQPVSLMEFLMS